MLPLGEAHHDAAAETEDGHIRTKTRHSVCTKQYIKFIRKLQAQRTDMRGNALPREILVNRQLIEFRHRIAVISFIFSLK